MAYDQKLLSKFNLGGKIVADQQVEDSAVADMMADPGYLRQSSAMINEALQKGFDVLQLANGDIVMTGIKTVVYQYSWDSQKGKLLRSKAKAKRRASSSVYAGLDEETEDA
jgi:hypothetical protein